MELIPITYYEIGNIGNQLTYWTDRNYNAWTCDRLDRNREQIHVHAATAAGQEPATPADTGRHAPTACRYNPRPGIGWTATRPRGNNPPALRRRHDARTDSARRRHDHLRRPATAGQDRNGREGTHT